MKILVSILITIATFIVMEFIAWFTHKYIMHGILWKLHYDHHNKQKGFFENNDTFFVIFAIPSAFLIIHGFSNNIMYSLATGMGILLYGIAYFLIHEVLIHKRFPKFRSVIFYKPHHSYLRALISAHKLHHSKLSKDNNESFGMLFVNKKYFQI